ncbi:MAG: copper chaperone PCu(A)C [Lautropia sp.]
MKAIRNSLLPIASLCAALIVLSPGAALAQQVGVEDAWVRATVAQQRASGAFMKLTAPASMKLVGARSPAAGIVEIHEMAMSGDMMKMRAVKAIELPAGKAVSLEPGGYHVMLIDLKKQIAAGDPVPITLVFEDAAGKQTTQDVTATARPLNAKAGAGMDHTMHGKGHKH